MSTYIVDSNFFIQAHRSSYPFDVAESFWTKFKELACSGRIVSIDKVKEEIYSSEDDLKVWCEGNLPENFFLDFTSEALQKYQEVCNWAQANEQYKQTAKEIFMDEKRADAFLVAFASTNTANWTIVTQEVSAPNSKSNIKLPDACQIKEVSCVNTIEMFRELCEKF